MCSAIIRNGSYNLKQQEEGGTPLLCHFYQAAMAYSTLGFNSCEQSLSQNTLALSRGKGITKNALINYSGE